MKVRGLIQRVIHLTRTMRCLEMSEDDLIVLGGKGAAESDGGSGKGGKKRRRGVKKKVKVQGEGGSRNKSKVWDVFDKVTMPDPNEKGKVLSKAKCKYCKKMYAYIQGSTTSTLSRHMKNCDMYKKHIAEKLDQKLLSFAPSKAGESGSSLPTITSPKDYNHDQVKKLIAKMIIVHEYPFRMVEHTWFNIVMTYLNPLYQFIGRKTIKAECLKVFESEKEALAKIIKGVDFISLTTDLWKMAKKFLIVPATSVSSESTFSTGGRTLDDYRSSLSPSTVEALICASSWIRGAHDGTRRYVVCYSLTICSSWFLFFCLTLITLSIFRKKMRRMTSRIFHFQKAL